MTTRPRGSRARPSRVRAIVVYPWLAGTVALAGVLAVGPRAHAQCPTASPGGLDASDGDFCGRITLNWNAPPGGGVSWYEIWRSQGTDFAQANLIATSVDPTFDDSPVANGTFYYYWITAWRVACAPGSNRSAPSARNQGLAQGPALLPVTGLAATGSCGQVELSWQAVSGVGVTYSISRQRQVAPLPIVIGMTALLHFTDDDPPDALLCDYHVSAVPLGCGTGGDPATVLGVRCHTIPPSSPTTATATEGTRCIGVTVGWSSVGSQADAYQIWRAPPGGSVALLATVGWDAEAYADTAAAPGVVYTYVVRSINSCGGSAGAMAAGYAPCRADINCSGGVEVQDIFDFLSAWFAGSPNADFNQTGAITVQDIFDFLSAWFAGC